MVLKGQLPSYKSVHTVFVNNVLQRFLQLVYQSYLDRSHLDGPPNLSEGPGYVPEYGRTDDQGNSWEQLKPVTYDIKQDIADRGKYASYVASRRSRAARHTHSLIKDIQPIEGDGINIRTGRLLAAMFPGPIINGRLVKTKDQNIEISGTSIHFDTDAIPYSEDVEASKRPIIPEDSFISWMQEAIDHAIPLAELEYQRLLEKARLKKRRQRARAKARR